MPTQHPRAVAAGAQRATAHKLGGLRSALIALTHLVGVLVLIAIVAPSVRAQDSTKKCLRDSAMTAGTAGELSLDAGLTRATTDKNTVSSTLSFDNVRNPTICGRKHQQTTVSLEAAYDDKQPEGKPLTITRRYDGTFQHQVYLVKDGIYAALNGRLFYNTDLGVYLSQRYSGVFGLRAGGRSTPIEIFAGPAFVGQHFLPNSTTGVREPSRSYFAAYVGESGSVRVAKLDSTREVTLTHGYWATIPLENKDPFALNTRAFLALYLPLTPRVGITLSGIDEYLRNAPPGFEHHFLTSKISFSLKFGNH